jgi:hypothetical protein
MADVGDGLTKISASLILHKRDEKILEYGNLRVPPEEVGAVKRAVEVAKQDGQERRRRSGAF